MSFRFSREIGAFVLFLMAASISGCATVKMDRKKPIESRSGFFGSFYEQDGKRLDLADMNSALYELPASEESAKKASTFNTLGLVTGIPGGFMVGWYFGSKISNKEPSTTLLYVGLPLWATGVVFELIAQGHLDDAIAAHNKSVTRSAEESGGMKWSPVLAAAPGVLSAGLQLQF